MDKSLRTKGIYAFSRFRLDTARGTLTRDGRPVVLSSKVFDLLLYFLENPDRIIEKEELLNTVWGGRYVEEANLSQTIFVLRKALKEAGEETSLIATVSGRGYRFNAPVRRELELPTPAAIAIVPESISPSSTAQDAVQQTGTTSDVSGRSPTSWWLVAAASLATAVLVVAAIMLFPRQRPTAAEHTGAFHPPPRSVAVLAFANMSGNASQDYLADGFSEELINSLSRVDALRVADRASAFYFKQHPATVADIARRLNVGAVLEGSVRRQGQRLRITAQLINASTGYQFWSRSYDRDFGDILKLQTEIAEDVTRSLQVTLQAQDRKQLTLGGTSNSAAFDAFLRGIRFMNGRDEPSYRLALAAFDESARLDPRYASAQSMRAVVMMFIATLSTANDRASVRQTLAQAMDAANRAVALAPSWGEAYAARGSVLVSLLDFSGADRDLSRARVLSPNDIGLDRPYAYLEAYFGHAAVAEAAAARFVARYPSDPTAYANQAEILYLDRHYPEALAANQHARALFVIEPPGDEAIAALAYLALGKPQAAYDICAPDKDWRQSLCLAIAANRLGRPSEAQARLAELRRIMGDTGAYQYVQIYAQWGDRNNALAWLVTAYRLHDTGLSQLKVDPLLDPIRGMSEFADIQRKLNFPP